MATIRDQLVDDSNIQIIARNMKELRLSKDISQEEAAFRCGISTRLYCDVENGKVNFSTATLFKICNGLETDINILCKSPSEKRND